MILIIDNYDSFTYNLVQYVGSLNYNIKVCKNDKLTINDINHISPDKIIISPGPGRPEDAGISVEIIKKYYKQIPILGICLGHQAIAIAFGGKIINSNEISHGKIVEINHSKSKIFKDIPNNFYATRYHSLMIDENSLSKTINIIAKTKNNIIMGVEHSSFNLFGLQFHPESIETKFGIKMIENFLLINNKEDKLCQ